MDRSDSNSKGTQVPYVPPSPLYLSSLDMHIFSELATQGVQYLHDNTVAQDVLQQFAVALLASMRVNELNPKMIPPPMCLTVTTMINVTGHG